MDQGERERARRGEVRRGDGDTGDTGETRRGGGGEGGRARGKLLAAWQGQGRPTAQHVCSAARLFGLPSRR